jgi:hypothetical protein
MAFAFALAVYPAQAAEKREQPRFHKDRQAPATTRMYLTSEELDKLESLSLEERAAFFKERHEKRAGLTEVEREKLRAKRKAAFDALPAAEQVTIKERTTRLLGDFKNIPERDVQAERIEAKKRVEEFFRNLSPEEKARWDEIKKNNKKWQEKSPASGKME